MVTTNCNQQERIARERLTQRPLFVGISDEVAVYWDGYERMFAAVGEDGTAETVALEETPFNSPREYCEHIRDVRGWDVGPHVGNSLVDQLAEAVR